MEGKAEAMIKNSIKKFEAVLLSILMVLSMTPAAAAEGSEPILSINDIESLSQGENAVVSLSLSNLPEGLYMLQTAVEYDAEKLKIISADTGDIFTTAGPATVNTTVPGMIYLNWDSTSQQITEDCVLLNMTFATISEEPCDTVVKVSETEDCILANWENSFTPVTKAGTIHITGYQKLLNGISLNQTELALEKGGTSELRVILDPADTTETPEFIWSSTNEQIAKVDQSGKVTAVSGGNAVVSVKTSDGRFSAECAVTVKVSMTDFTLSAEGEVELKKGSELTVTAQITPEDSTEKLIWTSSDEAVVSVDQNGKLTALNPGKATITVKNDNNTITKSFTVFVPVQASGISLDQDTKTIYLEESFELKASIVPSNADNKTVIWSSSDSSVASVDENGKVTGKKAGIATITAKTVDGGFEASCIVTVAVHAQSIRITTDISEIKRGISKQLEVEFTPADTTNKKVTWTSSDPAVAKVDEKGIVTGISEGTVTITVKSEDGAREDSVEITVISETTQGISFEQAEYKVPKGETLKTSLRYELESLTDETIIWSSDNEEAVTVDENGTVTGVAVGVAVITAKTEDGDYSAQCTVRTVILPEQIILSTSVSEIETGDSATIAIDFLPAETTEKDLIWKTSDESIAIVNENGVVTAVGEGTVTISASTPDGRLNVTKEITVSGIRVESITLKESRIVLPLHEKVFVDIIVKPQNASMKKIVFKSEDETIVKVTSFGFVEAMKEGKTKVIVSTEDGRISVACEIEVVTNGIYAKGLRESYDYTGSAIKPEIEVYDSGKLLNAKKDYTVSYKNNVKAGIATLTIKSVKSSNYKGTKTLNYVIEPINIGEENLEVTANALSVQATGKKLSPVPTLYWNGKKLKNKTDFTVSYLGWDRMSAGDYTIEITGKGNYTGSRLISLNAAPSGMTSMSKLKVTAASVPYTELTGIFKEDIIDRLTVKNGKTQLSYDWDFEVKEIPSDYEKIGNCNFVITGKGIYYGERTVTVKITGTSISDKKVIVRNTDVYRYTGEPIKLSENFTLLFNGEEISRDNYEILEDTYQNNIKAGNATVKVQGKNEFYGTRTITFAILPDVKSITKDDVKIGPAVYAKGGSKPEVTINGLTLGTDYTVKYINNTKAGSEGMVTVTFTGNYKGTPAVTKSFHVEPKHIIDTTITVKDIVLNTKAGKYKSAPVVTDTDGKKLKAGVDYTVSYELDFVPLGPKDRITEADTDIIVRVIGKGNYYGDTIEEYRILPKGKDISKASFKIKPQEYTGSEIELELFDDTITAKMGKTITLDNGTDFIIVGYSNNIKKGTAKVTFQGVGEYGGTKTVSFKIVQKNISTYWNGVVGFLADLF